MSQAPVEDLVRQAPFVFRGLVESAGATTTAAVATTDRTAIVRVTEVIRAPAAFRRLAGQTVTVTLRVAGQPPAGQTAVFFARTQLLADSLVLEEVAHRALDSAVASVGGLQDALAEHGDEKLRNRLGQASAVIIGRVSNVRPSTVVAASQQGQGFVSEHDPEWSEAVVEVQSVVKGAVAAAGPVVVLFPASIDVAWFQAPKYHAGQTGVWLLHDENVPAAAAAEYSAVYTSLDAVDFQPIEEQARVRSLIRSQ